MVYPYVMNGKRPRPNTFAGAAPKDGPRKSGNYLMV
jgi:hypothetical protein